MCVFHVSVFLINSFPYYRGIHERMGVCEKEGEGAVLADNTLHSFHIAAKRFG